jgi:RimJ/RimL family protein N-acetyltransferase
VIVDRGTGPMPALRSERLVLRDWTDADLEPFARLNADPVAMEHFPSTLDRAQSDAMVEVLRNRWRAHGLSWWAVEERASGEFLGAVGLLQVTVVAPFNDPDAPSVEVGWRLLPSSWGHGYAPEAAAAALDWGFGACDLSEIVSFTVPANQRSRRVMAKLGMTHDPAADFDHPSVDPSHALRRHVLYRLDGDDWRARHPQ